MVKPGVGSRGSLVGVENPRTGIRAETNEIHGGLSAGRRTPRADGVQGGRRVGRRKMVVPDSQSVEFQRVNGQGRVEEHLGHLMTHCPDTAHHLTEAVVLGVLESVQNVAGNFEHVRHFAVVVEVLLRGIEVGKLSHTISGG